MSAGHSDDIAAGKSSLPGVSQRFLADTLRDPGLDQRRRADAPRANEPDQVVEFNRGKHQRDLMRIRIGGKVIRAQFGKIGDIMGVPELSFLVNAGEGAPVEQVRRRDLVAVVGQ